MFSIYGRLQKGSVYPEKSPIYLCVAVEVQNEGMSMRQQIAREVRGVHTFYMYERLLNRCIYLEKSPICLCVSVGTQNGGMSLWL